MALQQPSPSAESSMSSGNADGEGIACVDFRRPPQSSDGDNATRAHRRQGTAHFASHERQFLRERSTDESARKTAHGDDAIRAEVMGDLAGNASNEQCQRGIFFAMEGDHEPEEADGMNVGSM